MLNLPLPEASKILTAKCFLSSILFLMCRRPCQGCLGRLSSGLLPSKQHQMQVLTTKWGAYNKLQTFMIRVNQIVISIHTIICTFADIGSHQFITRNSYLTSWKQIVFGLPWQQWCRSCFHLVGKNGTLPHLSTWYPPIQFSHDRFFSSWSTPWIKFIFIILFEFRSLMSRDIFYIFEKDFDYTTLEMSYFTFYNYLSLAIDH